MYIHAFKTTNIHSFKTMLKSVEFTLHSEETQPKLIQPKLIQIPKLIQPKLIQIQ